MVKHEHLRNVAIIAHVDHGKTTLVDGMLTSPVVPLKRKGAGEDDGQTSTSRGKRDHHHGEDTAVDYLGTKITS